MPLFVALVAPVILGVILAGGRATRMGGGDKPLLSLGDRRLVDHVLARLTPQVSAVALSANGDPARFADLGLPVLADTLPGHPGPLAGILAGLRWAAGQGADTLVSVAGDTPFFPRDLVARLAAARGTRPIALAASDEAGAPRVHPTFGLWPTALADDLAAALARGERRVLAYATLHGHALAQFDGHLPFFNVNAPEDLARAAGLAGAAP